MGDATRDLPGRVNPGPVASAFQFALTVQAGALTSFGEADSMKPTTACFNCESTSSAMAMTSSNTVLKFTRPRLFCRVLKDTNLKDSRLFDDHPNRVTLLVPQSPVLSCGA
jgi:hypothetical protein